VIVVDTSALMSIALGEATSDACIAALDSEDDILISAGTVAEALIVASRRNVEDDLRRLLEKVGFTAEPLTASRARAAAAAYARWGKGVHRAKLNLADCFAYQLARERDCALLFVGDDFALTDVKPAI
jgi:ribonuclease VapC